VVTKEDESLRSRLQELEKMQESSWEEKEKLSKQLEMERANNMVSGGLAHRSLHFFLPSMSTITEVTDSIHPSIPPHLPPLRARSSPVLLRMLKPRS